MAIRKSMEERVCVEGSRDAWFSKTSQALEVSGFKNVSRNDALFQVTADYKKATVWGEVLVTLLPATSEGQTDITIKSTANVDNAFALFKSPNKAIIEAFKSGLGKVQ